MPEEVPNDKVGEIDLDSVVVGVEDMDLQQLNEDVITWSRSSRQGVSVDASIIQQALATAMPGPEDADLFYEDEDLDDTYINDGVVPPFISMGEDSDDDFFV